MATSGRRMQQRRVTSGRSKEGWMKLAEDGSLSSDCEAARMLIAELDLLHG